MEYIGKYATKLNRAFKLAKTANYPNTFFALTNYIGPELRNRLTGHELALVIDALNDCAKQSKAIAAKEIVDDGCVWDSKLNKLREVG